MAERRYGALGRGNFGIGRFLRNKALAAGSDILSASPAALTRSWSRRPSNLCVSVGERSPPCALAIGPCRVLRKSLREEQSGPAPVGRAASEGPLGPYCAAAQFSDSTSACSNTVCVAFSCLSGG